MKMRLHRRRYQTWWLRGPYYGPWRRVLGKHIIMRAEEVGHDEHNCWMEYLIARYK